MSDETNTITRGGVTFESDVDIADADLMIIFQRLESREATPVSWAGQDAPTNGDAVRRDAMGMDEAEPLVWMVRARCWHASNLLVCVISPLDEAAGAPS